MKTNKLTKIIVTVLVIVIFSSLSISAFAETGAASSEAYAFKCGREENKKPHDEEKFNHGGEKHHGRRGKQKSIEDRFEDWFEDRIESRKDRVDFSTLPENPTEEELVEFFKKNFVDGGYAWKIDSATAPKTTDKTESAEPAASPEATDKTESAEPTAVPEATDKTDPAEPATGTAEKNPA